MTGRLHARADPLCSAAGSRSKLGRRRPWPVRDYSSAVGAHVSGDALAADRGLDAGRVRARSIGSVSRRRSAYTTRSTDALCDSRLHGGLAMAAIAHRSLDDCWRRWRIARPSRAAGARVALGPGDPSASLARWPRRLRSRVRTCSSDAALRAELPRRLASGICILSADVLTASPPSEIRSAGER